MLIYKVWPHCSPEDRKTSVTRLSIQKWRPNCNGCHKKKKIILNLLLQQRSWINRQPSREISNPFSASVFIKKGDPTATLNHNDGDDFNTLFDKEFSDVLLKYSVKWYNHTTSMIGEWNMITDVQRMILTRESQTTRKNPFSQCHLVQHKSHMGVHHAEPWTPRPHK